jgi:hypothetical protein
VAGFKLSLWLNHASVFCNGGGEAIMIQTVEAVIDQDGRVHLAKEISLPASRRALVTILEEKPVTIGSETALLSESSLAEDWNTPEEDEAWSHLQPAQ